MQLQSCQTGNHHRTTAARNRGSSCTLERAGFKDSEDQRSNRGEQGSTQNHTQQLLRHPLKNQTQNMKTTDPSIGRPGNRSFHRHHLLRLTLTVTCITLWIAPRVVAVNPPPDGGYPNPTTAEGQNALFNLTTGIDNTAVGFAALWNNTMGSYNTAAGEQTLYVNVSGNYNAATGYRALYSNIGSKNTADGFRALFSNTTGNQNTASGFQALYYNTDGEGNTATGNLALYKNVLGNSKHC